MTAKTIKVCADEWKKLPWKKFQKNLFRLQHRIYKAAKNNDFNSVKSLQSLLLGSKSSKYLAVRQAKAGEKESFQLVAELDSMKRWKHRKLRRFAKSTKSNRMDRRDLRDRTMQFLVKYALEPIYFNEPIFQLNFLRRSKAILEFNIEDCFDKINHEKILSFTTLPGVAKNFLRSALEAEVLKEGRKGIILPLFYKIAFDGLEKIKSQKYQYADEIVFILLPGESVERLINQVKEFLSTRGLKADEAKIKILSPTEGFDFLGWHFRIKAKNHKFVFYPSSKNRKELIHKLKSVMKNSKYKIDDRFKMIKTIYHDWLNYHQFSDMGQINLWSIRYWMYKYVRKITKMPSEDIIQHLKEL